MWQKIKKFFISNNIEEEHQKNMKQIEMQHQKTMQELIGLIEDIDRQEKEYFALYKELTAEQRKNFEATD